MFWIIKHDFGGMFFRPLRGGIRARFSQVAARAVEKPYFIPTKLLLGG
jgi:hypothetical protein